MPHLFKHSVMCALAYLGKQKCGIVVGSKSRINRGINVLKHVEQIDEDIAFSNVGSVVVDLAFLERVSWILLHNQSWYTSAGYLGAFASSWFLASVGSCHQYLITLLFLP
jgi:hypothetical protein